MDWHEVEADWQDGLSFLGVNDLGNQVQMGSKQEKGNISPMDVPVMTSFRS